jgi:hypothetical protein
MFMKRRIGAAAIAALLPLAAPRAASAREALPQACVDAQRDTAFTQAKRRCYETLTAEGRYQDALDAIETQPLGLTPQEKYFLGSSYFGLSNRTAAQGLKCFYTVRAKDFLEAFLVERQAMYRAQRSFGTSDDMIYVYRATKTLEALKGVSGCEESSHTPASLERFARKYAADRVHGLFYADGADTINGRFRAKLAQMNGTMREIVSVASQVETRYGLTSTEIDSARQYLLAVRDTINAQYGDARFGGPAVLVTPSATLDDRFPSFAWDARVKANVLADLDARASALEALVAPSGEIGKVKAQVLAIVGAVSMDEYARRKEERVREILQLETDVLLPVNLATELDAPARTWKAALEASMTKPIADDLARSVRALDAVWTDGMKARYCGDPSRWYCKGA